MALPKKNQLNQVLFVMVDSTDFASIRSALTNPPTGKFYGVNHNTSTAMTSGTLSKTISHVRSGLYRATLKAAETNYDHVTYRFVQPSCTDQIIPLFFVDNDDSDMMSALTVIQSLASDAHSAALQANSRILLVQSQASDTYSMLSDLRSLVIAGVGVTVSTMSDIASQVWAHAVGTRVDSRITLNLSRISDIHSLVSDFYSDFGSRVPKRVATDSQLSNLFSDMDSNFRSFIGDGIPLDASTMSDLRSAIAGATATLTASDISDIASAVQLILASDMSDILSGVRQTNSRVLVSQSHLSDIVSFLSDFSSDFQSRVPKRVATDSYLSDIHSDILSYLLGMSGMMSDTYSLLSDTNSDLRSLMTTTGVQLNASTMSDLRSAIGNVTATLTASDISDIASAVRATLVSDLSDIYSGVVQTNSRVLVTQSQLSDVSSYLVDMSGMMSNIYSLLSDTNSDLRSLMTVTGVQLNASTMSDIRSAIGNISVTLTASDISDIASAVAAAVTTITASDISDIASAVRAALISDFSDIYSGVVQTNSRVLLNQSRISDIYSLVSDFYSDFGSRVPKRVATDSQLSDALSDIKSAIGGIAASISPSDISDIASAVWANTIGARVDSRVLLNLSSTSDVYSQLLNVHSDLRSYLVGMSGMESDIYSLLAAGSPLDASTMSDLRSAIAAAAVTLDASTMSDIASQVWAHPSGQQVNSRLLVAQSSLSDIHSGVIQANSRLIEIKSQASDIYSLMTGFGSTLSDIQSEVSAFHSDFDSRFPATIPELITDPGDTPTWQQAEALQFMWLKNNTKSTSTKRFLRNGAGATVLSSTQADDGTSYVQGRLG